MKNNKGFTLIELMIVVAIIGILAAVAMPRFADLVRKSNEGATKGKLGAIKSALSIYYADNEGVWPATIAGMVSILVDGGSAHKYLDKVPVRKVGGGAAHDGESGEGAIDAAAWNYDSATGDVLVASSGTDTKGVQYTAW